MEKWSKKKNPLLLRNRSSQDPKLVSFSGQEGNETVLYELLSGRKLTSLPSIKSDP